MARSLDLVDFAISMDTELFKHFNINDNAEQAVVLLKNFDEAQNILEGEFDEEELTKFVNQNTIPLMVEFSKMPVSFKSLSCNINDRR